MTLHTNQSSTNTQELHCVTNKENIGNHVYQLYTPVLDNSSIFIFLPNIFVVPLSVFPFFAEEFTQHQTFVSTTLAHGPWRV